MAPYTLFDYLSRGNPESSYKYGGGSSTLTVNDRWLPIEGVRRWDDFTFDILTTRYKSSLSKSISPYDPTQLIKNGRLNDIVNEDTVTWLTTVNNLMPVSNALNEARKGLHYGPGSKFFRQQSDGSPDFGLGIDGELNDNILTLRNICPGDLKVYSKWNANGIFETDWSNYLENSALVNQARPLEQAQHYGLSLNTRYACILTDAELLVIRISTSPNEPHSPRQHRVASRRRVLSDASAISQPFSNMSLDHSASSGYTSGSSAIDPAPLEIAWIPWSAGSKKQSKGKYQEMTINSPAWLLKIV